MKVRHLYGNQLCEIGPKSEAGQSFAWAVEKSTTLQSNPWEVVLIALE